MAKWDDARIEAEMRKVVTSAGISDDGDVAFDALIQGGVALVRRVRDEQREADAEKVETIVDHYKQVEFGVVKRGYTPLSENAALTAARYCAAAIRGEQKG